MTIESTHTRYIFEAVESIRLAKTAEEQFEHAQASKLYETAAHLFITGVQQDPNKSRQELVRKKLAKCLFKSERCRAIAKNRTQNPEPGGQSQEIISWPHDLKLYQLKQVITSDIWLVARLIDRDDKNLALMAGIPKISTVSPYHNPHRQSSLGIGHQETVEAIDTSQLQQMELGKALSLRTAAIMYRPNKFHVTTGQKFLQEFITQICLEIRTEYTIFCIVRATEETLSYARNVRKIVTSIRHKDCINSPSHNSCQACRLRETQRCIRLSSSSSENNSPERRNSLAILQTVEPIDTPSTHPDLDSVRSVKSETVLEVEVVASDGGGSSTQPTSGVCTESQHLTSSSNEGNSSRCPSSETTQSHSESIGSQEIVKEVAGLKIDCGQFEEIEIQH